MRLSKRDRTVYAGLCLVLSLFICCVSVAAQDREQPKERGLVPEIINRDGWVIPGLDHFRKIGKKSVLSLDPQIEVEHLKLNKVDIYFENADYSYGDNAYFVKFYRAKVSSISRYSHNGKVYGYRVFYSPVAVINKRTLVVLGAIMQKTYIDRDGDGKFETLSNSKDQIPTAPDRALR